MVLAAAGIRYFGRGIKADPRHPLNLVPRQVPFCWAAPDGSRVLTLYVENYAYASRWALDASLGGRTGEGFSRPLGGYEARADYPFDAVFLHGAVSDNCPLKPELAGGVAAGRTLEYPKIILSHNADYFAYIEKKYGDKLPVYRGSGGAYWEDGARLVGPRDDALPWRPRSGWPTRRRRWPWPSGSAGRKSTGPTPSTTSGATACFTTSTPHRALLGRRAGERLHQGPMEDQGPVRPRRGRWGNGHAG